MLLERLGETVTLEPAEGDPVEVPHVLCLEADVSDQSVIDVQTRFINQARYKGDNVTLTVWWPKRAPHDLMDSHLVIRGERYRVYGAPFSVARSPNGYDARLTAIRSLFLYECDLVRIAYEEDEWGTLQPTGEELTHTACNLLRLSEATEAAALQTDLSRTVLLELPPGTWGDGYAHFDFQGNRHAVSGVERAGDVVVVSGVREVTDGH